MRLAVAMREVVDPEAGPPIQKAERRKYPTPVDTTKWVNLNDLTFPQELKDEYSQYMLWRHHQLSSEVNKFLDDNSLWHDVRLDWSIQFWQWKAIELFEELNPERTPSRPGVEPVTPPARRSGRAIAT